MKGTTETYGAEVTGRPWLDRDGGNGTVGESGGRERGTTMGVGRVGER